jgi:ATP-binding cassette, subfamily B, bacterial PglK
MDTFKKLLFLLSSNERKHLGLLLIMIIMMALLDMIGIASIMPFISVLSNPSLVETNIILKKIFKFSNNFGVKTNQEFLIFLGLILFFFLTASLTFKALTTYLQTRFVSMREYSIGKRLVEGYLHQPYSWLLSRNSAELGKTILSEVSQLVGNGIQPLMELITKGVLSIAIIALLFVIDPMLALIVGSTLGISYLIVFRLVGKFLTRNGEVRLKNNQIRFTTLSEAFGAFKEVKFGSLEKYHIKNFSKSAYIFAKTFASLQILGLLPRFFLEAITFGGMLIIILYMLDRSENFNDSVPILALYAFAAYRLMPALQSIYISLTQLAFFRTSINKVYSEIANFKEVNKNQDNDIIRLDKEIVFKQVSYNYPNNSRTALKDINLTIPSKSKVGFVGSTGSGKTTAIDIILGLLEPQKGTIEVDGKIITKHNLFSWRQSIGYVPQHIYLSDNTVMANIAFGVDTKSINKDMVKKAAKIANLHQFIDEQLPKKYETIIGERGIKLSGGERQRIGIARALYNNPKILILDEATSALDNQTEKKVMDAINKLRKDLTIIMIAHRLNTVKKSDIIFQFDHGKLVNKGTYEELFKN